MVRRPDGHIPHITAKLAVSAIANVRYGLLVVVLPWGS